MTTLYLTHPLCLEHDTGYGHPERADRLRAVEAVLGEEPFAGLERELAPPASLVAVEQAHPRAYIEAVRAAIPKQGHVHLDPDTAVSPKSFEAALVAVGAGIRAVDRVVAGEVANAFCAIRPPGHHAEPTRAMGFCLFDNIALAALHARARHGAERIAVVDFDVHHGNGTQTIFWSDEDLFYGSTHQMPLFPGTGALEETGVGNIFNAPLKAGDGGAVFREACEERILPALDAFAPDLVLISAGFDAHVRDPLANIELVEEDFAWITARLAEAADKHAGGRLVSMLEGGYDLQALAGSVAAHVAVLMDAGS